MNILITQRHELNKHQDWIDSLENRYIAFFEPFDLNLIPVPNTGKNLDGLFDAFNPSGIVLSGGGDADLANDRGKCESKLIEFAIDRDIPVLGICRGMQFINVYFGGSLIDVGQIDPGLAHDGIREHPIQVTHEDILGSLEGIRELSTNSYHEQGVLKEGLGSDIGIFATFDKLGLVEGLYHEKYPIAGVQWHPERKASAALLDEVLINGFLNKALFWRDRR